MVTEISEIKGVGSRTLEKLESVGIENLNHLADADIEQVIEAGISEQKAEKMIQRAKESNLSVQTASERQKEYDSRNTVSSGIEELDEIIGGGYEAENVINIFGRSGSGKTQLSFQSCISAVQETGNPAVYIETERNRFRPNRVKELADDESVVDDIYVVPAYSLDDQLNSYSKVQEEFPNAGIVVVDSFNSRFRLGGDFDGRGTLSSRSELIGKHIREIEKMASELSSPVILTSQIYDSPTQYGKSDIPWGGNLFAHSVTYNLRIKPATGDLHEVTVEGHPEFGEESVNLNIGEKIIGISKS